MIPPSSLVARAWPDGIRGRPGILAACLFHDLMFDANQQAFHDQAFAAVALFLGQSLAREINSTESIDYLLPYLD